MELTKEQIRTNKPKVYYRAIERDECYCSVIIDIVGRFETLKEARKACHKWWEEVSEESWLETQKYVYDEETDKYKMIKDDYKI